MSHHSNGIPPGDSGHQPMDCAVHDQLELAIMREQKLRMSWQDDDGQPVAAVVRPLDTVACKGVEYLNFLHNGEEVIIRLDQISDFEVYDGSR